MEFRKYSLPLQSYYQLRPFMKHIIITLTLFGITAILNSCVKSRTCRCTENDNGKITTTTVTVRTTKRLAKTTCEGFQQTGSGYSLSCVLDK